MHRDMCHSIVRPFPVVLRRSAARTARATCLFAWLLASAFVGTACGHQTGGSQAPRAPAPTLVDDAVPTGQLPADVQPTAAAITWHIDPDAARWSGRTTVDVTFARPRVHFWMHGATLTITDAHLTDAQGHRRALLVQPDPASETLRLVAPSVIAPGRYAVELAFDAPFGDGLRGLYRVRSGGDAYAFTQFEAHDLRRAVPSFDEPRFKIPYTITLHTPAALTAVSNMPVARAHVKGGTRITTFAPTPALSGYLLAAAVGPFDVVEAEIPPNTIRAAPLPFRGIAPRGQGQQLAYAMAHTPPLLAALERYFGTPHPYPKLDIIAVPDFAAGAMENAGAITFRDSLLLVDGAQAPAWQKSVFARVMAHELAHQWFGNLVTMAWWDDLWLNEAFATWMGERVTHEVYPALNVDQLGTTRTLSAMHTDQLTSARAIRQPIRSLADIENAFDSITYAKGGAVLNMLENWLGDDVFQRGVQRAMRTHALGTQTAAQFADALSAEAGQDVWPVLGPLLAQRGLPVVRATRTCRDVELAVGPAPGDTRSPAPRWLLPVCLKAGYGKTAATTCTTLDDTPRTVTLAAPEGLSADVCPDWHWANADAAGYYGTLLSATDLEGLTRGGLAQLTAKEQLAVLGALSLSAGHGISAGQGLHAQLALLDSTRHTRVRDAALFRLQDTLSMLHGAVVHGRTAVDEIVLAVRAEKALATRMREVLWPVAKRLGVHQRAADTDDMRRHRAQVWSTLVRDVPVAFANSALLPHGKALLGLGKVDPAFDRELATIALFVAIRTQRGAWATARTRLEHATDPVVRSALLRAMAAVVARNTEAHGADFEALLRTGQVRQNEVLTALIGVGQTQSGRALVARWFAADLDGLAARASRAHRFARVFSGSCDEADVDRVEALLGPQRETIGASAREIALVKEQITRCVATYQTALPQLSEALKAP